MSTFLTAAIGCVYFAIALDQLWKGATGQAIMFIGYALGNVGICLIVK